jgi:hypothetical protein
VVAGERNNVMEGEMALDTQNAPLFRGDNDNFKVFDFHSREQLFVVLMPLTGSWPLIQD